MLDIIKTEKANKTPLRIYKDYRYYCVERDWWIGNYPRFKVQFKSVFENDFKYLHKLIKEDGFGTTFGFNKQIKGFLFDEGYLKEVEVETDSDDECETENRGGQASTSA